MFVLLQCLYECLFKALSNKELFIIKNIYKNQEEVFKLFKINESLDWIYVHVGD